MSYDYRSTTEWRRLENALHEFLRAENERSETPDNILIDFVITTAHEYTDPGLALDGSLHTIYSNSHRGYVVRGVLGEALARLDAPDDE